jgi:type VI secretion system protein ImpM
MSTEVVQNEFGYFGKLPTLGDFVHQLLPQDFVNGWHEWLQQSMAEAREALGDDFLSYYLNCPVWKFLLSPGVCGDQAVAGLTMSSVDKVGRYFNFTIATVLPTGTDPCTYALSNREGLMELETLALDILEHDYPKDEIELKVRDLSFQFKVPPATRQDFETGSEFIRAYQDEAFPFSNQAGGLLTHLITQSLGDFSIWWYGQAGQTRSQILTCHGLPSAEMYTRLLTLEDPPETVEEELDYVDKIIAGDV